MQSTTLNTLLDTGIEPSLWSILRHYARSIPNVEAILSPDRAALTFGALPACVNNIRIVLNQYGIGRGDRVVVAMPNSPEMATCYLGVATCATFIALNPSYSADEFVRYLKRLQPKVLILPKGGGDAARLAAQTLGIKVMDLVVQTNEFAGSFVLTGSTDAPCADPSWNTPDDIGLILHTSGTTSQQKLVPITNRCQVAYATGMQNWDGLGPVDRCLHFTPMFHGHGVQASLIVPILSGSGVVVLPQFDVSGFFETLAEFRPTWYSAGYTFHRAIFDKVGEYREIAEQSSLRFIRSGWGRLDSAVREGLEAAFCAPVIERYGMSEAGTLTSNPLPPGQSKAGSVGLPVYNDVAIMDAAGSFLDPMETGEIVTRGPMVFDGYLEDATANAAAFINGWFRTGDVGIFDEDGYLTITGRVKELINRGGEKIGPLEVERILSRHAAVQDVCVFGLPHPSLGEEIAAAVIPDVKIEISEEALKNFARQMLANFKVPQRIFFIDKFQLGATGKFDRQAIAAQCAALREMGPAMVKDDVKPDGDMLEEDIANLFRHLLECESVPLNESFFLLGGDSLKAVELLLRIQNKFGVDLSPDLLSEGPASVGAIAAEVRQAKLAHNTHAGASSNAGACNAAKRTKAPSISPHSNTPLIDGHDVLTLLTLFCLSPFACCTPLGWQLDFARFIARVHIAMRGVRAHEIVGAMRLLPSPREAHQVEQGVLASNYLGMMETIREYMPLRSEQPIRLHGAEHLAAAIAAGKGAVIWFNPMTRGVLAWKTALQQHGAPVTTLRSALHPYSGTRFGQLLNRFSNRIDDQFQRSSVTLIENQEVAALDALQACLHDGQPIAISANGANGRPFEIPFLGGTLRLSLGAPSLAIMANAPLLPLFAAPTRSGRYEIFIEPPLQPPPKLSIKEQAQEMATAFSARLYSHLQRHPEIWQCWFQRNTWRAGPTQASLSGRETSA